MNRVATLAAAVAATMAASLPAAAHHSAAMFDASRTVELTGTVKAFEWTNPHSWIWIMVPQGKGAPTLWGGEFGGAINLARDGLTRHSMKPGDKIVLSLHPAKSKESAGQVVKIVAEDGKQLYPAKKDG